jgi:hypothetical protein
VDKFYTDVTFSLRTKKTSSKIPNIMELLGSGDTIAFLIKQEA